MTLAADDILAIQKLIADYNHAVDAGDGAAFAALFVDGGSLDSGFNVIKGHDELRDFAGIVPSMAPGARHEQSLGAHRIEMSELSPTMKR